MRLNYFKLRFILAIAATMLSAIISTAAGTNDTPAWTDIRTLGVEGRGWNDTKDFFDRLPAKDHNLARTWITAHLLLALLIDDTAAEMAASFP